MTGLAVPRAVLVLLIPVAVVGIVVTMTVFLGAVGLGLLALAWLLSVDLRRATREQRPVSGWTIAGLVVILGLVVVAALLLGVLPDGPNAYTESASSLTISAGVLAWWLALAAGTAALAAAARHHEGSVAG